jgi:hypothetical protein
MSQFYRLSHYRAAGNAEICSGNNEAVRRFGHGSWARRDRKWFCGHKIDFTSWRLMIYDLR